MSVTTCTTCGLPKFDGAASYCGPQCKCEFKTLPQMYDRQLVEIAELKTEVYDLRQQLAAAIERESQAQGESGGAVGEYSAQLETLREVVAGMFFVAGMTAKGRDDGKLAKATALRLIDDLIATPPQPERSGVPDEVYRGIFKVIEEAGEMLQVLGKLGPFPNGKHPDGKEDLRTRLKEEMADLRAAMRYMTEEEGLENDHWHIREKEKFDKFTKWGLTGLLSPTAEQGGEKE